ncbi:MAG: hypothetical protein DRH56_09660 [Deltaproteobacteria bacterium]|nr:MAG: hypothetical protein DRH56_09660 [Deltaproteobacteria bacterium]
MHLTIPYITKKSLLWILELNTKAFIQQGLSLNLLIKLSTEDLLKQYSGKVQMTTRYINLIKALLSMNSGI